MRRLSHQQVCLVSQDFLERAMGFEPTTPTLARLCSTPELHPHPKRGYAAKAANSSYAKTGPALQPMRPPGPCRHAGPRGQGRDGRGCMLYWRAILARSRRPASVMAIASRSNVANVVPFPRPRPRPFRAAAAPEDGVRASGNAALLGVAVLVVVGGVFLVEGIT